jgi:cytochrome c biogenesis protein CcmG/thiol:disulfide interchange protein DsbE
LYRPVLRQTLRLLHRSNRGTPLRTDLIKALKLFILLSAVGILAVVFFRDRSGPSTSATATTGRRQKLDFRLNDLAGSRWQLSDRRGKVVLVNFWATWCPPCREETPGLVRLYRDYRPRGVEMVGIAMDDDPHQAVPPFLQRFHVPYPVLVPDLSFDLANQIESLPTTLLIDRQGRVAKVYVGAIPQSEVEDELDVLLKESS